MVTTRSQTSMDDAGIPSRSRIQGGGNELEDDVLAELGSEDVPTIEGAVVRETDMGRAGGSEDVPAVEGAVVQETDMGRTVGKENPMLTEDREETQKQIQQIFQQMNTFSQILNQVLGAQQRPDLKSHRQAAMRKEVADDEDIVERCRDDGSPHREKRKEGGNFRFLHGEPPFSQKILNAAMPRKLTLPKLDQYDGSTDPKDHLIQYQNCMALQNETSEALICRAFITSLKGAALAWFHRLPAGSIHSYSQLAERFISRFVASCRLRRAPAYLLQIKQSKGESLREYIARFSAEMTSIDGCSEDFIISAMARGLLPGRLADSMLMNPPTSASRMLEKAQKYIKLEEFKAVGKEEDNKSAKRGRFEKGTTSQSQESRSENFHFIRAVDQIYKEIKGKIDLRLPQTMKTPMERRDKTKFCEFHNDVGHRTAECKNLIWELENLARSGKIDEFLEKP